MTKPGLDIHEEILVRLQVNDLIRCKSVCKSWNSLISSGCFIKCHLDYNLKKKEDNNETGDTRITALYASDGFYNDECLVGSSNGLVCISRYVFEFLVVNPATREVKELRNPRRGYNSESACVSGFGYDSSIDDYKVVIGFKNEYKKLVFQVLTLKSNVWRSVAVESGYDILSGKGILCSGAVHWTSYYQNVKQVIVSFDLSKEVFKQIPLPTLGRDYWHLGTMKGRLCILHSPDFKKSNTKIWVMRSYNVQESWERKLTPPGYNTHKPVMSYILQEDDFNHHVDIWLLEEGWGAPVLMRSIARPHHKYLHRNIDNGNIRLSTFSECNYNYDEHVFVKSLVSPHGMGDGDDGDRGDGNINDVISLSTLFL